MPTTLTRNHRSLACSLGAWVTQLVETFPDFDEYDLCQVIEEKTGLAVGQEDFESIRAYYLRAKLQAWSAEPGDLEA
jgi:hypothetical protein